MRALGDQTLSGEGTMRKIALVNQKGGCGKTTSAINIAGFLASKDRRVLLVDLDPQGHSGLGFGLQPESFAKSVFEVLTGTMAISEAVQGIRPNLDMIGSNVVLSAFEQAMAGAHGRESLLAGNLTALEDRYDYAIIDCPPSVGLLTFNALMAANEVIIPVDSSSFSLNGLGKLLETLQLVAERTGHRLAYTILATNIDRRTNFGRAMVENLQARFPGHLFATFINACTRLREAAGHGKPIREYDRSCAAFRDYNLLSEEIIAAESKFLQQLSVKPVLFEINAPEDALVQIAGDFTGWQPERLQLIRERDETKWQTVKRLRKGRYQYKYLVNGQWTLDPANDHRRSNSFGSSNSVISI